jgi:transposase
MARRKSTEALGVRSIKELLRIRGLGRSINEAARGAGIARSTAQEYVQRAATAGVTYERIKDLCDEEVLGCLGLSRVKPSSPGGGAVLPDFAVLQRELMRKGVTLYLLWEEYKRATPDGYSYSNFCLHYRRWCGEQRLSFRQVYKAGEKMFTDYAGMKVTINPAHGGSFEAEIFVSVLGASNFTYAEAAPSQNLSCWIGSHERALKYFGGVPELEVIDNLKAGVSKACRYEPEVNRTFAEFAAHYRLAVLPTRTLAPRDKAKVEEAVQNVERRILAPLRDREFASIDELNRAIVPLREELNSRRMQDYGCSRRELWEAIEKPALRALPVQPFEFGSWKGVKLNVDYHIELNRHYYSAPYQLRGKKIEVFFTEKTVSVFHDGKRVAHHLRDNTPFKHTTVKEHMPPAHQAMLDWTPSRFINWGEKLGTDVKKQVEALLNSRQHPQQAYRSCLGLLRLAKKFGEQRLNAACSIANSLNVASMKRVESILLRGYDKLSKESVPASQPATHQNIRGGEYYH